MKRYTNFINLSGLYSRVPVKCSKRKNGAYWDKEGNVCAEELGLKCGDGIIKFTSISEKEVALWTSGAMSCMRLLREWSSN